MNAVILAGGKGTRLAPYTTVFPKPMLPIGDKPILDTIIKQLAYYGFDEIFLSVGYLAELLQAYFENCNGMPEKVKISYVREKHPLGTAGSLSLIPKQNEPILVMNGDTLTTIDYRQLVEDHIKMMQ
jgi:NDP-sugar pyrophosphorylase family protein